MLAAAVAVSLVAVSFAALLGCTCQSEEPGDAASGGDQRQAPSSPESSQGPRALYLPDATAELSSRDGLDLPARARRCPDDMVDVAGEFCIDRYESYLVDHDDERLLSPFYHPTRERTKSSYDYWKAPHPEDMPLLGARVMPAPDLPLPPPWQLRGSFRPRALNRAGMRPQGFMSGEAARIACENAGKRLCREEEWVRACRGELDTAFPYGDSYEPGVCNVARESHPAAILHGNASTGHRDPRLNLVEDAAGPLLRSTGSLPGCASHWAEDAIYDLVGNLDEWVDDETGVFVGGFFSRQTEAGCAARIGAHAFAYYDYSLGLRCCR